ncbi:hypothetical protein [Streptomyces sp. NPDC088752]|uniref:hypothetical protein n=1 Tax=Streptomyces sp. NPDC088752 TaxID=3154963 RepID=UPI003421FD64
MAPQDKIGRSVEVAREFIADTAPGLATFTDIAKKVADDDGISAATARKRLRAAIEAGILLELKPSHQWGTKRWTVQLPGADSAGAGPFFVTTKRTGPMTTDPILSVITTDRGARAPGDFGPGHITYLVDPEWIREVAQQFAEEKAAEEQAKREARKNARRAEREEIDRRVPGLLKALRKIELFIPRGGAERASGRASLDDRSGEVIAEHPLFTDIHVTGSSGGAILTSILEAGMEAHLAKQPYTECEHCGTRILHTADHDGDFWWHVETAREACTEGDTKAVPTSAEENR